MRERLNDGLLFGADLRPHAPNTPLEQIQPFLPRYGPQYVHYVNRADPVPIIFSRLLHRATSMGEGAVTIDFTAVHVTWLSSMNHHPALYIARRIPFTQARTCSALAQCGDSRRAHPARQSIGLQSLVAVPGRGNSWEAASRVSVMREEPNG